MKGDWEMPKGTWMRERERERAREVGRNNNKILNIWQLDWTSKEEMDTDWMMEKERGWERQLERKGSSQQQETKTKKEDGRKEKCGNKQRQTPPKPKWEKVLYLFGLQQVSSEKWVPFRRLQDCRMTIAPERPKNGFWSFMVLVLLSVLPRNSQKRNNLEVFALARNKPQEKSKRKGEFWAKQGLKKQQDWTVMIGLWLLQLQTAIRTVMVDFAGDSVQYRTFGPTENVFGLDRFGKVRETRLTGF